MSEQLTEDPQPDALGQTESDVSAQSPADEQSPDPQPDAAHTPVPDNGGAPETGDLVIDAALRDLADAPADDLDAQIERGEQVQRTLQGRLSDLGG